MLLLIAVLAVLSAATLLFLRKRRQRLTFTPNRPNYFAEETHLRPLFAPENADLERDELQKAAMKQAMIIEAENERLRSNLERARRDWNAAPIARTTAALLEVATNSKRADTFAETAFEILQAFRESRLTGIARDDLAALLDSHYRLLPASERGSGAIFLIKEEIAKLRAS
jgi:hypothetical protein